MRQKVTKRRISALLILTMSFTLWACQSPGSDQKSAPDNDACNNGFFAVMETESGYYMNHWCTQHLRYYDKESGNDIYLCPKPECRHDGSESCTATYRNMRVVNSVLYDNAIYILSIEEKDSTAGYFLYRAALDGSTLDRIGCAFSAENTTGEDPSWVGDGNYEEGYMPTFIIHRGYAYIPFFLSFKRTIMGFVNGGIIKMDIKSGKAEQIYAMSDFHDSTPQKLRAHGKYVFFDICGGSKKKQDTLCYDSENGEMFCPFGEGADNSLSYSVAETEELVFEESILKQEDGSFLVVLIPHRIRADQQESEEQLPETQIPLDDRGIFTVNIYENRIFVFSENRTCIYDMSGKKLGELLNPPDDGSPSSRMPSFKITNGKLYAVCRPAMPAPWVNQESPSAAAIAYSCPIEDILAGNGSWMPTYTISNEWLPYYESGEFDEWSGFIYSFEL